MYPHLEESELQRRVKLHVAATRPELARLSVWAHGSTVRLSGQVASFYLRQLALEAAKHVAGVQRVIDDLEVPILQVQNYQPATGTAEPISTQRDGLYAAAGWLEAPHPGDQRPSLES
jgi:hypothetical protein